MKQANPKFSFFPHPLPFAQCSATIGNFDACHLGHKKLLENNRRLASQQQCPSTVLSFNPLPHQFFNKNKDLRVLLSQERKNRAFKEHSMDHHFVLSFNDELREMSHELFYESFLKNHLHVQALTIGADFQFGKDRLGTAEWLYKRAKKDGILVDIISPLLQDGNPISSTRVRKLLDQEGDVDKVYSLLGHLFSIEGQVHQGKQKGKGLGFPTLNLSVENQFYPAEGVYCGYVWLAGASDSEKAPIFDMDKKKLFKAVFNLGKQPTFGETKVSLEAHLLDFKPSGSKTSHYGSKAAFYFLKRLRHVQKFKNIEELKLQIQRDIDTAKKIL